MDKLWYSHTMEYYLAMILKNLLVHAGIWISLKKQYAKQKEPSTEEYLPHNSI